jgi:hypothetical protein
MSLASIEEIDGFELMLKRVPLDAPGEPNSTQCLSSLAWLAMMQRFLVLGRLDVWLGWPYWVN